MAAGPERKQRHPPLAGPLTRRHAAPGGRALLASTALVLLLHALALSALSALMRPPSLLQDMAPPLYTRTITPEAPVEVAAAPAVAEPAPSRPAAVIRPAPTAATAPAPTPAAPEPKPAASAAAKPVPPQAPAPGPEPEPAPEPTEAMLAEASAETETETETETHIEAEIAAAPSPTATDTPPDAATAAVPNATAAPAAAASAAEPAFLASWPGDTRLSYKLGGHYRGELHGDARVMWQRQGTRYHTAVELSVGILASLSFTSQGDITAAGLRPEVYEENVRGRRRGVRLGEDVRLNNGTRLPRPEAVQDTASQFVELGHRFATGQASLTPGARIDFSMARPGGIDDWTYDVIGEETLHLPRLGPVQTYHLRPRPLSKPRGPISAEIWYAPSLQYLPVRIRITQGPDNYIDLLVDTIEQ